MLPHAVLLLAVFLRWPAPMAEVGRRHTGERHVKLRAGHTVGLPRGSVQAGICGIVIRRPCEAIVSVSLKAGGLVEMSGLRVL